MAIGRRKAIWRMGLAVLMAAIAFTSRLGVSAQAPNQLSGRWLEVSKIIGQVTYQRNGAREAKVGDRLDAVGQGIITGPNSSVILEIDSSIGTVTVAANSQLLVQRLGTLNDGGRVTILDVPRGQARIQARTFTNPSSRLELHTPSGIAAVRGTEFGINVNTLGQTNIGTLRGTVEASAQGQNVKVEAGSASTIRPGYPPTTPQPLDHELNLEIIDIYRRERTIYIQGRVDPTDHLLLDGSEVSLDRLGGFETRVDVRNLAQVLTLTVANPLGETRNHPFPAWQLDNVDGGTGPQQ